jgi:hypothetical protein
MLPCGQKSKGLIVNYLPFVGLAGLAALVMGSRTADEERPARDRYMMSSTHRAAASPEQSAYCLAKNARAAGAPASEVQPLFGMTHVAVIMREHATGDTLAVASLEPANPGSIVRIDTTPYVEDREKLVTQLLSGC